VDEKTGASLNVDFLADSSVSYCKSDYIILMITIACSSSSMLEERIEVSNPGVDKQRRKSGLEDL